MLPNGRKASVGSSGIATLPSDLLRHPQGCCDFNGVQEKVAITFLFQERIVVVNRRNIPSCTFEFGAFFGRSISDETIAALNAETIACKTILSCTRISSYLGSSS